jgi:hypothetical protein
LRDLSTSEIRKLMDRTTFLAYNVLRAARGAPVFLLMPRNSSGPERGSEIAWHMCVGAAGALESCVPNFTLLAGGWDALGWAKLLVYSVGEHR